MRNVFAFAVAALILPFGAIAKHTPPRAAQAAYDRAVALNEKDKPLEALAAFIEAVEKDPDFVRAHEELRRFRFDWEERAFRDDSFKLPAEEIGKTLDAQYPKWEQRFPKSYGVAYGLGAALVAKEDPKARDYLLRVVAKEPKVASVYPMLSTDAERRGDAAGASEYRRKAAQLEPGNAEYAFDYAMGLHDVAPEKWEAACMDVVQRFPAHQRGAQTLYWFGRMSSSDAKRIAAWERLYREFPPEKFDWSKSGMPLLFEAYLRTDAQKAVSFAQEMQRRVAPADLQEQGKPNASRRTDGPAAPPRSPAAEWLARVELARTYLDVNARLAAGQPAEAVKLLDGLTPDRNSPNASMLLRLKAQVLAAAGQQKTAYESLLREQAKTPEDETGTALVRHGAGLGRTAVQVAEDLKMQRDANAREAPAFDLPMYTSDKSLSLASLRGKVVFLTFWFPGCGPCRMEFPHFESVMRKFRGQDVVYLGVNGLPDQDPYVLPFMQGTKYSFIPLKATEAVKGADGYKVKSYPSNFLIDRSGRVVYSAFRARDDATERSLQLMIESLLAPLPAPGSRTAIADELENSHRDVVKLRKAQQTPGAAIDTAAQARLRSLFQQATDLYARQPDDLAAYRALQFVFRYCHEASGEDLERCRQVMPGAQQTVLQHQRGRSLTGFATATTDVDFLDALYDQAKADIAEVAGKAWVEKYHDPRISPQLREKAHRQVVKYAQAVAASGNDDMTRWISAGMLTSVEQLAVGKVMPDFGFRTFDGKPDAPASHNGKIVLIDFWATWCVPCIASMPDIAKLRAELAGKPFEAISVNAGDSVEKAKGFQDSGKVSMPWLNWHIPTGSEEFFRLGMASLPTYFVLDTDGKILARGGHFDEELRQTIRTAVARAAKSKR